MEPIREFGTMKEIGFEHDLDYRQEVIRPLFASIKSAESCYLIGAGSIGKTRILDFIMRKDVQETYLGDKAARTLVIRLDMNRIYDFTEWGFYELALSTLIQTIRQSKHIGLEKLAEALTKEFLVPVLNEPLNTIKALRFLELSITHIMIQPEDFNICFVLDEFDEAYKELPPKLFAHLRGIRDTHKNRLSYALFLRNLPKLLRNPSVNESFYELLSRTRIGIGPYSEADSIAMLKQLEERKGTIISLPGTREKIFHASGGHPGLILAMFGLLTQIPEDDHHLIDFGWLAEQPNIKEECRKLFESLLVDERQQLAEFAKNRSTSIPPDIATTLFAKGILRFEERKVEIFSPIFNIYLQRLT